MDSFNDPKQTSTIEPQDAHAKRDDLENQNANNKKQADQRKETQDQYNKTSEEAKKDQEEKELQRLREHNAREFKAMLEADPALHHYRKPEIVDRIEEEDLDEDVSIQDARSLGDNKLLKEATVRVHDPDFDPGFLRSNKDFLYKITENSVTSLNRPRNMAEYERISEHLLNIAGEMKGFTGKIVFDIDKPEDITPEKIEVFLKLAAKKGIEVEFGKNVDAFLKSNRATSDPMRNVHRNLLGQVEPGNGKTLSEKEVADRMKKMNELRVVQGEIAQETAKKYKQDPVIQSRVNDVADQKKIDLEKVPPLDLTKPSETKTESIAKYNNMNVDQFNAAAKVELDKIEKSLDNVDASLKRLDDQIIKLQTQLEQDPTKAQKVIDVIDSTAKERSVLVDTLQKELDQLNMHIAVIQTSAAKQYDINHTPENQTITSRANELAKRFDEDVNPNEATNGRRLGDLTQKFSDLRENAENTKQQQQEQDHTTTRRQGPPG